MQWRYTNVVNGFFWNVRRSSCKIIYLCWCIYKAMGKISLLKLISFFFFIYCSCIMQLLECKICGFLKNVIFFSDSKFQLCNVTLILPTEWKNVRKTLNHHDVNYTDNFRNDKRLNKDSVCYLEYLFHNTACMIPAYCNTSPELNSSCHFVISHAYFKSLSLLSLSL